ncbi:MAG: pyridoxal phosphate-dependent aminotransferase [Betaproteobacteria bacterium]
MNNLSNARHMDLARLAKRLDNIEPFYVVQVITRAIELEAQGKSIINLAVGEPDFPTPQPIVDAAVAALKSDRMRYSPSLGSDALRQALSNWYQSRYAVDVPAERIAVTSGASGALLLTMGMVISEGDEVLMPDPSYPCNRHFVSTMGGSARLIPVGAETDYQLTSLLVEQNWTERTVGVMVASPSNPTGTLMDHDELQKIVEFVRGRGGVVIVDENYQGLSYEGQVRTALDISDDVFVINSFSKYFAMTGWRLGWAVMPEGYVEHFEKLAQNLYISNSDVAQRAALSAFDLETIEEAEKNRSRYKEQRDFLLPALRDLGFKIPVEPSGAFYIYADCTNFTNDSYSFSHDVLEKAGVAIAPGLDFGDHRANEHVRFSYPKPIPVLQEGIRRLKEFTSK